MEADEAENERAYSELLDDQYLSIEQQRARADGATNPAPPDKRSV
ncbi:hypothetical protein SEA_PUPPER_149 [Gordonia phage Pupper]|uniref:Uncharacterized protein n=1 Tax=Gordonia phage Pupper TaxID=2571249 RepID=A0A4Y6EKR4_9CAUD|nr:hypothetical protein KHQ83_gp128 [Gordonia phage Pupper]QDF18635.1 hypothetical protein SEA_PUPPER_149 [Gordonia phage Pupper]